MAVHDEDEQFFKLQFATKEELDSAGGNRKEVVSTNVTIEPASFSELRDIMQGLSDHYEITVALRLKEYKIK